MLTETVSISVSGVNSDWQWVARSSSGPSSHLTPFNGRCWGLYLRVTLEAIAECVNQAHGGHSGRPLVQPPAPAWLAFSDLSVSPARQNCLFWGGGSQKTLCSDYLYPLQIRPVLCSEPFFPNRFPRRFMKKCRETTLCCVRVERGAFSWVFQNSPPQVLAPFSEARESYSFIFIFFGGGVYSGW